MNKRPKLEGRKEPASVDYWVILGVAGGNQIPITNWFNPINCSRSRLVGVKSLLHHTPAIIIEVIQSGDQARVSGLTGEALVRLGRYCFLAGHRPTSNYCANERDQPANERQPASHQHHLNSHN